MADVDELRLKVAAMAADIIATTTDTRYVHVAEIDAPAGIYRLDCSEFVSYILGQLAGHHLTQIPVTAVVNRPLAANYQDFLAGLSTETTDGWLGVPLLAEAQRGDIVAWRLDQAPPKDTGHVFIVAAPPVLRADGRLSISVYDSSDKHHLDDSRGGAGEFATGVGSGEILFTLDAGGLATGCQFDINSTLIAAPIAAGRIEPFSAD